MRHAVGEKIRHPLRDGDAAPVRDRLIEPVAEDLLVRRIVEKRAYVVGRELLRTGVARAQIEEPFSKLVGVVGQCQGAEKERDGIVVRAVVIARRENRRMTSS